MRGRIKLALTSGTLVAGSAIAYHFVGHATLTAQPAALPAVSTVANVIPPPPPPPTAKPAVHPFRTAISNLGMASFYSDFFNGKRTANGEVFDQNLMTACHKTLPFGTLMRVINVATGRSVVVRINDRGILTPSRVIDLSHAAATEIGMLESGVAKVRLEILGRVKRVDAQAL